MVTVSDILDHLVSRSCVPSNMGAQLERMRDGMHTPPDAYRLKEDAESHMLAQAVLLRCVDAFARRKVFHIAVRQRKAADAGYKTLSKVQASAPSMPQGTLALRILSSFHERVRGTEQERALAAVYEYVATVAPTVAPPPSKRAGDNLTEAFRKGEAKAARNFACEAYADSLLALQHHVHVWNK